MFATNTEWFLRTTQNGVGWGRNKRIGTVMMQKGILEAFWAIKQHFTSKFPCWAQCWQRTQVIAFRCHRVTIRKHAWPGLMSTILTNWILTATCHCFALETGFAGSTDLGLLLWGGASSSESSCTWVSAGAFWRPSDPAQAFRTPWSWSLNFCSSESTTFSLLASSVSSWIGWGIDKLPSFTVLLYIYQVISPRWYLP